MIIKEFKVKTRKRGSDKEETIKIMAKSMAKALEYLSDMKYEEPLAIEVLDTHQSLRKPD